VLSVVPYEFFRASPIPARFAFLVDAQEFSLKSRSVAAVQSVVVLDRCAIGQVTHAIQQHKGSPFLNLKKSGLILIRSDSL